MRIGLSLLLVLLFVAASGRESVLGLPIPSGAALRGGLTVKSVLPEWELQPVIPASQQQAQETVLGYLKRTLLALPPGTVLDANGHGATSSITCAPAIGVPPSVDFATIGDLKPPSGTDFEAVVAQVGDIWRSWGWYVMQRDGFFKPNRFGYAPDGYSLQIESSYRPDYPPALEGVAPCFPGDLPDDRSPFPMILTAD